MKKTLLITVFLLISVSRTYQSSDDESNPFLDMASSFISDTLANQNGGAGGIGGIASVIGSLMQGGKSSGDNGAAQILSGIGSFIASAAANNNNGQNGGSGGGGFDPSMVINMVSMFANMNQDQNSRVKRDSENPTMDAFLSIASTVLQNMNSGDEEEIPKKAGKQQKNAGNGNGMGDAMMNMLPMVMQVINSFSGPEMNKAEERHKDHAQVLPPFLEYLHIIWDQFQNSDLSQVLFLKLGLNNVFKVRTGFHTLQ